LNPDCIPTRWWGDRRGGACGRWGGLLRWALAWTWKTLPGSRWGRRAWAAAPAAAARERSDRGIPLVLLRRRRRRRRGEGGGRRGDVASRANGGSLGSPWSGRARNGEGWGRCAEGDDEAQAEAEATTC
jgi:hypothetical protein